MSAEQPSITFDEDCKIRVLDAETFKQTQSLAQEANNFVNKIDEFKATVHSLVEVLGGHADKIEKQKLKAIGQRNKVESEQENRVRQKRLLTALLAEKEAELQRYDAQYESLRKVDQDQRTMIEKLSNNEA